MRTFILPLLLYAVCMASCGVAASKSDHPEPADSSTHEESPKEFATPLLETTSRQQQYIAAHNISSIWCLSRKVGRAKDSFALAEIQAFDKAGREVKAVAVNKGNTDTFRTKTFEYNSNGVLLRINMRLENGQTTDESFAYTKEGKLRNSFVIGLTSTAIDTFLYKYSKDTIYKYYVDGGEVVLHPDVQVLNANGWVVTSIDHLPPGSTPPYEISQRSYRGPSPIPDKEIINAGRSDARERVFQLHYF